MFNNDAFPRVIFMRYLS